MNNRFHFSPVISFNCQEGLWSPMTGRIPLFVLLLFAGYILFAGCVSQPPAMPTPTQTSGPGLPVEKPSEEATAAVSPARTASASVSPTVSGGALMPITYVTLTAFNDTFDRSVINVPAGYWVGVTFVNRDANVPHNFAVYTDSNATRKIYAGGMVTGVRTVTYTFKAPYAPGNYTFRSDSHPETMTGTLVVT